MRLATALIALLMLSACASIERLAIPRASIGNSIWQQHAAGSATAVDHGVWDRFLRTYVRTDGAGVNRVAYARVTAADRAALRTYLARLSRVQVTGLNRREQLAYWINLYNAQTVAVVLEAYPVRSIREIKSGLVSIGPWDRKVVTVMGQRLSLNDIEHRIVRPVWRDPRIHYAFNCAAVGCPNLARAAYRGATINAALDAAEQAYVNNPRGVTVDHRGRLVLSKIYLWFREDFGTTQQILRRLAEKVRDPAIRARLRDAQRPYTYRYDWRLNDQAAPQN